MTSEMKQLVALWGITAMHNNASNAVPELTRIFDRNPNELAREIVPAILSGIGQQAKAAIPQLLRGMADTNPNVRMNSIFALGQIHAQPGLVVPALTKCLSDPAPDVRGAAARALGAFGSDAQAALLALQELLKAEQLKTPAPTGPNNNYNWTVGISRPGRSAAFPAFDVTSMVTNAINAIAPEPAGWDASIQKWQPLEKNKQSGGFSD